MNQPTITPEMRTELTAGLDEIFRECLRQTYYIVKYRYEIYCRYGVEFIPINRKITFREAVRIIYLHGLNEGILQRLSPRDIFNILDIETELEPILNQKVVKMYDVPNPSSVKSKGSNHTPPKKKRK